MEMKTPLLLTLLIAVNCSCARAEAPSKTLQLALFSKQDFTCADVALAVNHFVELGQKRAVLELIDVGWPDDVHRMYSRTERTFWIASILYRPRDSSVVGSGYLGGLGLPKMKDMDLNWPYFPAVEIDKQYFILASGSVGTGVPRDILQYIVWCQRYGTFRETRVPVPEPKSLTVSLDKFFESPKWVAFMKVSILREETERFMRNQIPRQISKGPSQPTGKP